MPWTLFDTAIGPCGVAWTDAGLTWVQLPEHDRKATRGRLLAKTASAEGIASAKATPPWVKDAIARVREHLGGKPQELGRIPLDVSGLSDFTAKVFRAAQAVPAGRTTTYGELATTVGSPGASRAVGRAMATNPWPVIVPCHRVVAAGGGAGGFSAYGGVLTKERILKVEGGTLAASSQTSLFDAGTLQARPLPYDGAGAIRALTAADPVLGRHIARTGPLRLQLKESEGIFAALAESIVYQQLSGRAAATIFGRLRSIYPGGRLEPKGVLATPEGQLRGAGLSAAKLASLLDLAARSVAGAVPTLAQLGHMADDEIVDRLTSIRGVGRWTVEMLLIFRLGRADVLPVADYGIKKGFARVFKNPERGGRTKYGSDELPSAKVLAARGERWRPFRSVASWYLWRALDEVPQTQVPAD